MFIQHVAMKIPMITCAPPAGQKRWINLMLKVREYMLASSWGGAQLGGKGSVQRVFSHSYAKYSTVVYYTCTGMQIANINKKCSIQKQRFGIVLCVLTRSYLAGPATML